MVLVARRMVAGPREFFATGANGALPAPKPAVPSFDTRGTCNKEHMLEDKVATNIL